jgi:Rod binding domain-containing protein
MPGAPIVSPQLSLGGLAQFAAGSSIPKPANAQEAAVQFESLLIGEMLRSAHEASPGSLSGDDDEDSQSATQFDIAGQQFAELIAKQGGLGLARLITQGLNRQVDPQGWNRKD